MSIEDWVKKITKAHNNHAKAIEVLELRERSLHERQGALEEVVNDQRKAINALMEHLEFTAEGNGVT